MLIYFVIYKKYAETLLTFWRNSQMANVDGMD